jgi:hypothetical protein
MEQDMSMTESAVDLDWPVARLLDHHIYGDESFYLVEWESTKIRADQERWLSHATIDGVSLLSFADSCHLVDDMIIVEWECQWISVKELGGAVEAVQTYWMRIVENMR